VTLANPELGPERQHGWDAGLDAGFAGGASLSLTYYDQTAEGLVQFVQLQSTPVITFQARNVGRVNNTGIEIEGTLPVGPVRLKAQYGYARARIEQLSPTYAGDLRVGDQTLMTPHHTAGASVAVSPFAGTNVSVGLTYVGSWNNYDYFAQYSCFGHTGPCQASNRDYIVGYPGFVKLNAHASQQITPVIAAFVSVDNLTNNEDHEVSSFTPIIGRTTTLGLQVHY
jgi:outer membrane receptor protein involved in Fe transport